MFDMKSLWALLARVCVVSVRMEDRDVGLPAKPSSSFAEALDNHSSGHGYVPIVLGNALVINCIGKYAHVLA